jgi:hypothetical protein
MDEFDAITADLQAEDRCEQIDQAREILAAGDAERGFADVLRAVVPGASVVVATADGWFVRGRILRVGRDWVRVSEVRDDAGTARLAAARLHDVRLDAVVRISRESDR